MALQSSLRNMVVVLVGAGILAALGLGVVSELTKKPIEKAQSEKVISALREVLPAFDNNPAEEMEVQRVDGGELVVYTARMGGEQVGTAVRSFSSLGFGGDISVMVGFDSEGKINGYSVLDQAETPGLGTKMVDWFKPQGDPVVSVVERLFGFRMPESRRQSNIYGMNPGIAPLQVSKDGGQIDAITSATISSRAFLDAVNRAYLGINMSAGVATGATLNQQGDTTLSAESAQD